MLPPIKWLKNCAPNIRSNNNKIKAAVNGGKPNKIKELVTNVVHVNNGIRINVIPGARMLMIVTKKLIPEINVPAPDTCKPKT